MKGKDKMKKRPEVTAKTKNEFIETFIELARNKKFYKITVKELCQRAGYNRSTFYQYFNDTYDLHEKIKERTLSALNNVFENNLVNWNSKGFVDIFIAFYQSEKMYFQYLLGENGDTSFRKDLKRSIKPVVFKTFNSSKDNVYADYISEFMISAMINIVFYWYEDENRISQKELSGIIESVAVNSIIPMLNTL